jgi:hypothetical protein
MARCYWLDTRFYLNDPDILFPSTVSTILKYRSGQIPSLGDNGFHVARLGADTVSEKQQTSPVLLSHG